MGGPSSSPSHSVNVAAGTRTLCVRAARDGVLARGAQIVCRGSPKRSLYALPELERAARVATAERLREILSGKVAACRLLAASPHAPAPAMTTIGHCLDQIRVNDL